MMATAKLSARLLGVCFVLVSGLSTAVQAAPLFSDSPTQSCVDQAQASTPSLSGYAVLDCVGRSAQACMATPGGDNTLGMMECLQQEREFWDRRLNAAYAKRMAAARAEDAAPSGLRRSSVSLAQRLRDMQRAWIGYRDAACLYEQSQWLGGSGAGPATMACHLQETARQALKLEGWWAQ